MNETQRRESHKLRILDVLRQRGAMGITNVELSQMISLRYNDGLHRLYKLGYKIENEDLGNGLYKYTLVSEPEEELAPKPSAYEALIEEVDKEEIIDSETLKKILDKVGITVRYKPYTYNVG